MSIQIADLTQQLQNALDSNYNVLNMAEVLQVITALEGIQITKEQLESTRLGKHINHLRRMTKNESLARRAKNLLKKWREMVLPTASAAASIAASSVPSNPINSMPPSAMAVNGYAAQEYRSHQNQSIKGGGAVSVALHDSDVGAGNQQNHHSNGNKKSANNSNRKFGGGGSGSSGMPTNNFSCNNSVNIVADQLMGDSIEADVRRKTIGNSKQRRNIGDASTIPPISDPYRFLQIQNESGESISPISISALPKIPKKTSSSSTSSLAASSALNVNNKTSVERSHSPFLLNSSSGIKSNQSSPASKWSLTAGGGPMQHQQQQQKLFSSIIDDNTVHQYDMQHHGVKSAINGRDQNFYSLNSGEKPPSSFSLADNNSNSSSMRDRDVSRGGVVDPLSINDRTNPITNETKKKHKKNKKEKKKKRHSASSADKSVEIIVTAPPIATMVPTPRVAAPAPVVFELADSLSSSSMSLFNSTNNSMKVLPKTNAVSDNGGGSRSMSRSASTIPPADLTFSGKFSKTEGTVINIDSSSCSNSPKYAKLPSERSRSPMMVVPSRSSSPIQMKKVLGDRLGGIDDESLGQSTSVLVVVPLSLPCFVGDNLSQDITDTLSAAKKPTPMAANANGQAAMPVATTPAVAPASTATNVPQPKKRGRKKGSKGVDGRLAANLAQKMQSGSQYDTLSLMSLKNQIDSMRGNAKKVKTTKELLAELQNRNTTGAGFDSSNSNAIGGGIGSNFGSRTSSPIATSHYQFVASPSENSERSQSNSTVDMRSTTATPLSISPALSSVANLEGSIQSESAAIHRGGRLWDAPRADTSDRKHFRKSKSIPRDESSQPMENADEMVPTVVHDDTPKRTIDDDIAELREQFAPIDEAALLAWHEHEMNETVECTCTLLEVESDEMCDAPEKVQPSAEDDKTIVPKIQQIDFGVDNPTAITAATVVTHATTLEHHPNSAAIEPPIEVAMGHIENQSQLPTPTPPPSVAKKPAMKSIFDLDYEEDDDPIHAFKTNNNIININNNNDNSNNNININLNINNNHNDNDKNKSCDEPNFLHEEVKEATTTSATTHTSIASSTNAYYEPNSTGTAAVSDARALLITDEGTAAALKDETDNGDADNMIPKSNAAKVTPHGKMNGADAMKPKSNEISMPEITIVAPPPPLPSACTEQPPPNMLPPHVKRFEVQEDPECKAKQVFVTSKMFITEFHIVELHNSCIPNVNGNWDDSDIDVLSTVKSEVEIRTEEPKDTLSTEDASEWKKLPKEEVVEDDGDSHVTEATVGLYERVVPLCNHLAMDRLPKNLRNLKLELPTIPPSPPTVSPPPHEKSQVSDEMEVEVSVEIQADIEAPDVAELVADELDDRNYVQSIEIDPRASSELLHSQTEHDDTVVVDANDVVEPPVEKEDCATEIHTVKSGIKRQRSTNGSSDEDTESSKNKFQCTDRIAVSETKVMPIINADETTVLCDQNIVADEPEGEPEQSEQQQSPVDITEPEILIELSPFADRAENAETEKQIHDIRSGTESPPVKKKQLKPVKYKIRRNSGEPISGTGNDEIDNESHRNGETDVGRKIILKLSRQFTVDYTDENDYDDTEYMDDNENGSEASDYSENEDDDDDDDDYIEKNYEEDTSNHFITLKNFDTESDDEPNVIENEIDNQDDLFENIIGLDDDQEMDDDSDTVSNVMMFCKPVMEDCKSSSNLFNDTASESMPSLLADDPAMSLVDVTMPLIEETPPNTVDPTSLLDDTFLEANVLCAEDNYDIKLNDVVDISACTPIVSQTNNGEIFNEIINNRKKRARSCSTSSTSSTSETSTSSSSCGSTPSQRKLKKKKKRRRRRPCPQHYRCAFTSSSSSSSVSPMTVLPVKSVTEPIDINAIASSTNAPELLHKENHIENNHSNTDSVAATKCDEAVDGGEAPISDLAYVDGGSTSTHHPGVQSSPISMNLDSQRDEATIADDVNGDDDDDKPNSLHQLIGENSGLLPSFNNLNDENVSGTRENGYKFKEWYEVVHVKSYNDELLTILPYVVID